VVKIVPTVQAAAPLVTDFGTSNMSTLSPIEHTAIGALAGVLEVSVMQPTVTVKNALQEGRALPKTPLAFYRGYLVCMCHVLNHENVQDGALPTLKPSLCRSMLAALLLLQLSNSGPTSSTR